MLPIAWRKSGGFNQVRHAVRRAGEKCRSGKRTWGACGLLGLMLSAWAAEPDLALRSLPHARFHLEGVAGERLKAGIHGWLLPAPESNPGLVEMFRLRDRQPRIEWVPWAGEFVGKYLISGIQALRMTEHPDLRATVNRTVTEFIATQAEDGYLGPFPREARLKGNWDLWGHYHGMLALLMWHEMTGDTNALAACRRAADLVCRTYLDTGQRVFDAGSHEMNMAVIHSLGWLFRLTRDPRYWQMMREIEKDWERAGDYLRTGLAGLEFFETPRPRWESLHDLQGLVELYRISGEEKYRAAFVHHWRSIARWDRRNTGGFSSGEQATGNPYAPTAIETCCTVAWMALTIDMLQLTGDTQAADELELSFFNAGLAAQHPSGRWCTYNTPMNGVREASAHTIVFQARAGTPELNCCSVNGPRALGSLSEWAVMAREDGLALNYFGPGMFQGKLADHTPVAIQGVTDYPLSNRVTLRVEPLAARQFRLFVRVPAWSRNTVVELNGQRLSQPPAGRYLELNRRWQPGDRVALQLDFQLRAVPGDREELGHVSVYRGPLLLAYDQALNPFDENDLPPLDLAHLNEATEPVLRKPGTVNSLAPWLTLDLPATAGRRVRVCDFASAGARGTRYRSWLPVSQPLPPPVVTRRPRDGAAIGLGDTRFRWTGPRRPGVSADEYELLISPREDLADPVINLTGPWTNQLALGEETMRRLKPGQPYWWRVISKNASGRTESTSPAAWFKVDPTLAPSSAPQSRSGGSGENDLLISARLAGEAQPQVGTLRAAAGVRAAAGLQETPEAAIQTDGETGRLIFEVDEFPEEDYSATVWVCLDAFPQGRLGQVCSAWTAPMDDPLRIVAEEGKIYARLEAGQAYGTAGVPVQTGRWYHLAFVKAGARLSLYVDGEPRGEALAPLFIRTQAREIALGGNPCYSGPEFLAARFTHFTFHGRALQADEIKAMMRTTRGGL